MKPPHIDAPVPMLVEATGARLLVLAPLPMAPALAAGALTLPAAAPVHRSVDLPGMALGKHVAAAGRAPAVSRSANG